MDTSAFKTKSEIRERTFPSLGNYWVIGLDIGYSGIKAISPNKVFCIPSYARQIPEGRQSLREAAKMDILYRDKTGTWAVGPLAYDEVNASDIPDSETELFSRHRYYSPMFQAIANTSIALAMMGNGCGNAKGKKVVVQTGLPPKYLDAKDDVDALRSVIAGSHSFEIKVGKGMWQRFEYTIEERYVLVMSQPLGALISASVDSSGRTVSSARRYFNSNVIVLDPGFGTLDSYTVKKGSPVGKETFPNLAMREVFARTCNEIQEVYGVNLDVPELQNHLESGKVRVLDKKSMRRKEVSFTGILEKHCHDVCMEAVEKMKVVHNYFIDTDYIIAAGGTFDAWEKIITNVFKDMEGLQIVPGNINDRSLSNIYSNVRGYYFYCLNALKQGGIQ